MSISELRAPSHVPLVHVMRSGMVESVHYGSVVVVAPDGATRFSAGDGAAACYPRSSLKPVQATAMVRAGLDLPPDLLALVAASHSGERIHLEGVRRILARHGLAEDDLRNTPAYPLSSKARNAWIRAGRGVERISQNCSGKHSGMLATAQTNGWCTVDYLDPDHPLQKEIARTVEELSGESIAHVAVDGCGAPLFALSLTGLTRAVSKVAAAQADSAEGRVADAIRRHPEMLGGTDRPVTRLIKAVPGLIAKDGAEGVFVAALPDGTAVGVKIADGAARARVKVAAAALALFGVDTDLLAPFFDGAPGTVADGIELVEQLVA
ncbi:MAG: asparaginase [Haloechinothrix sp.]